MERNLFVYGSLMKGQSAESYMGGCGYLGKYVLRGYALYSLGEYPGIVPEDDGLVFGEVYTVPEDKLAAMDKYEDEGVMYRRTPLNVEKNGSIITADVYVYINELGGARLSGPWNCSDEDPILLNLSEDEKTPVMITRGRLNELIKEKERQPFVYAGAVFEGFEQDPQAFYDGAAVMQDVCSEADSRTFAGRIAAELPVYSIAEQTLLPGRYRHFKGKEYELISLARHSETGELMAVYRALYGEKGLWVRPASMWCETVLRDGKEYRRFSYIGPMEPDQKGEI